MQISIPEKPYGKDSYHMPKVIFDWMVERNLISVYTGSVSLGNGGGIWHNFIVYYPSENICIPTEDATAFKLKFPECEVNV